MEFHEVERRSEPEVFHYGPIAKPLAFVLIGTAIAAYAAYHTLLRKGDIWAGLLFALAVIVGLYGIPFLILSRIRGRVEIFPDRVVIHPALGTPISIHNDHLHMLQQWETQGGTVYFKLIVEGGKSYRVSEYERPWRLNELLLERIGETQKEMKPKVLGDSQFKVRNVFALYKWLGSFLWNPLAALRKPPALEPHSQRDEDRNR